MAFTVGWPGGSSPVSVADADAYFADRGLPDWQGIDAVKQGALTRATDYVKAMFAWRFKPELFLVVDDVVTIPEQLAKAVAEYALIELKLPGSLAPPPVVDPSGFAVVKTSKRVGPIETRFSIADAARAKQQTRRLFPVPDALIAQLLLPSPGMTRTLR